MNQEVTKVIEEINKVIIGKETIAKKVFEAILAGGHVLLEDIPGVGKTTLALSFSKILGLDFNRMQFTPDVVASDVTGFTMYDKHQDKFVYKEGVVMCHLLLADEINRTTSRTQSALLEVMEEKNVTVDGTTYELPKPFHVIATQNPDGSAGTQALPQSQLDRFMIKTSLGYPDFSSQVAILKDRKTSDPLDEVKPILTKEQLVALQEEVRQIHISDEILHYITELVEATRKHPLIQIGVSPRGAIALSTIVKAHAFVEGRDYVVPEDVITLFNDTCSHRIVLAQRAQMTPDSAQEILTEIINEVKTPDNQTVTV